MHYSAFITSSTYLEEKIRWKTISSFSGRRPSGWVRNVGEGLETYDPAIMIAGIPSATSSVNPCNKCQIVINM